MIIWLKHQSKVRYRTFQLRFAQPVLAYEEEAPEPGFGAGLPAVVAVLAVGALAGATVGRAVVRPKLAIFRNFLNFFAIFWRARSRLYQNEFLQENMRLTAFFEIYKITPLHRSKFKTLANFRQTVSYVCSIFCKKCLICL